MDPEINDDNFNLHIYNYAHWERNITIGLEGLGAHNIALGLETYPEGPVGYGSDYHDVEGEEEGDYDFDDGDSDEGECEDECEDEYEYESEEEEWGGGGGGGGRGEAYRPRQADSELEARQRDFERREAAGRDLIQASCTTYMSVRWWRMCNLHQLWVALKEGCDLQGCAQARQTARMLFDNLCIDRGERLEHFVDRLSLRRQALAGTDQEVDDSAFAAQIFKAVVWSPRLANAVGPVYQLFRIESDLDRFMSRLQLLEVPPPNEPRQQEHGRQAPGGPAIARPSGGRTGGLVDQEGHQPPVTLMTHGALWGAVVSSLGSGAQR